ncbi:MAG TPA: hypothetical protein VKT52_00135, partial [Ktedonobacterales bacterium]|nr:hypothetical protein [Ktedonobacterales bacterium]
AAKAETPPDSDSCDALEDAMCHLSLHPAATAFRHRWNTPMKRLDNRVPALSRQYTGTNPLVQEASQV